MLIFAHCVINVVKHFWTFLGNIILQKQFNPAREMHFAEELAGAECDVYPVVSKK